MNITVVLRDQSSTGSAAGSVELQGLAPAITLRDLIRTRVPAGHARRRLMAQGAGGARDEHDPDAASLVGRALARAVDPASWDVPELRRLAEVKAILSATDDVRRACVIELARATVALEPRSHVAERILKLASRKRRSAHGANGCSTSRSRSRSSRPFAKPTRSRRRRPRRAPTPTASPPTSSASPRRGRS